MTAKGIEWADLIFVMGKQHRQWKQERYGMETTSGKVVVLDIPDDYQYMDPEQIEEIKAGVDPYLK